MSLGTLKWRDVCKSNEKENSCVCDVTVLLYSDNDDVLDTRKQSATRTKSFLPFILGALSVYTTGTGTSFTAKEKLTSDVQLL
jgi:hypothetical protein